MPEPRATARLQLRQGFSLQDAAAHVPYYAALGVSHLYLSPIALARKGSTHGYDVTDPRRIDPALGGETGLRALAEALHQHDMGCLLDIVPNHMAADTANPWWRDVLAQGRASPWADFFDIDWDAPGRDGRLLLPVLDGDLDGALRSGSLTLVFDEAEPAFALGDQRYPLCAASRRALPRGKSRGRVGHRALRRLLDMQHYELADWRRAARELNYRRFFDISGLAALRMEHPAAFEAVHALPLRLLAEGLIDGLRIDHVDGLSAPRAYLRRLRRRMRAACADRPGTPLLYVEKILVDDEALPADWPVDGTTGYDFMDQAGALLHDAAGEAPLRRAWHALGDDDGDLDAQERRARRELLDGRLHAEFAACVRAWQALLQDVPSRAGFPDTGLAAALAELLARMRVYRTYAGAGVLSAADRAALEAAFQAADADGDPGLSAARDWLRAQWFDRPLCRVAPGAARARLRLARRRFEQLSAPLQAKAVEDTLFYRYGALLSRNEVGADPRRFALSPAAFHAAALRRAGALPRALLATATHDHKRGEDTRARMAVLSECAGWFSARASDWIARLQAAAGTPMPAAADLWMLLQTLLAAWSPSLHEDDAVGLTAYAERLIDWQRKALREAGLRSAWNAPDAAYEEACARLLKALFGDAATLVPLRAELAAAARRLDAPGALNGLTQCVLRLSVPGVPDLYQGTERWDFSLVDPDNRGAVDYALREAGPAPDADPHALLRSWRDGALKQWLIARLLDARRGHPQLFAHGDYRPLPLRGRQAMHAIAFARTHGDACWIVVLPRLAAGLLGTASMPLVPAGTWEDTALMLPADMASTWHALFTGEVHRSDDAQLPLSAVLRRWPVAVLQARPAPDESAGPRKPMNDREERIRRMAHRIWESEGRPQGQAERHWRMAERLVDADATVEDEQPARHDDDTRQP